MSARTRRRALAALAAGPILVAALAVPASAHVTVNPNTAVEGSYSKLTFRVPNEMDDANTTKLAVQFPTDHPLASVSVKPHDGWTVDVQMAKLPTPITTDDGQVTDAVSTITWTATNGGIVPGQFDEFDVSAGPFPTTGGTMSFPALQTYSNGQVVSWIDPVVEGQAEPDHPAPTLTLTGGTATDPHGMTVSSTATPAPTEAATTGAPQATTASSTTKTSDGTARTLGIVGIAVGVLGTGAGAALGRRRA